MNTTPPPRIPTEGINTVGWPAELMQNHVFECHAEITDLKREIATLRTTLKAVADEVRAYQDSPRSYSGDSYLPEKFVEMIRKALLTPEAK